MKVFITGANGYIGYAVARKCVTEGHQVTGLVRTQTNADKLLVDGITAVIGDLAYPEDFVPLFPQFDAVIHAGFATDPDKGPAYSALTERALVHSAIETLTGSNTLFIYTSGTGVLGETGTTAAEESFTGKPLPFLQWRRDLEEEIIQANSFHGIVVRPGMVYGNGSGPVVQLMFTYGRQKGKMSYVGDGHNLWSAIHLDDLASFYCALLHTPKTGEIFHAVSDAAISMKELAINISRRLGFTADPDSISVETALLSYPFAPLLPLNIVASNSKAKSLIRWHPQQISVSEAISRYHF